MRILIKESDIKQSKFDSLNEKLNGFFYKAKTHPSFVFLLPNEMVKDKVFDFIYSKPNKCELNTYMYIKENYPYKNFHPVGGLLTVNKNLRKNL